MINLRPEQFILIGFFLVLLGFVLPLLMVVHVIQTTYVLSFVSSGAATAGLFMGIIGASRYIRLNRKE
jgi:Trk-type K+ transport system membrane component